MKTKLLFLIIPVVFSALLARAAQFVTDFNSVDNTQARANVTNIAQIPLAAQSGTALDWSGASHEKGLHRIITTDTTFTFANVPTSTTNSKTLVLLLTNNAAGGVAAVTFPGTVQWPGSASAPGVMQLSNSVSVFVFRQFAGMVFGTLVMADSQTPWRQTIRGAGYTLQDAGNIHVLDAYERSLLVTGNAVVLGQGSVSGSFNGSSESHFQKNLSVGSNASHSVSTHAYVLRLVNYAAVGASNFLATLIGGSEDGNGDDIYSTVIRSNGYVGIGTNFPQVPLHVGNGGSAIVDGTVTAAGFTATNVAGTAVVAKLITIGTNNLLELYVGNTRVGYFTTNGAFVSSGSTAGSAIYYAADGSTIKASLNVSDSGNVSNSGGLYPASTSQFAGNLIMGAGGNTTLFANGVVVLAAQPIYWGGFSAGGVRLAKGTGVNIASLVVGSGDGGFYPTNNLVTSGSVLATNGFASFKSNLIAPTSITFPATTVNWTNPLNVNIDLYIDNTGVTATAIKKNGTQIFTTGNATIGLQPGEYISETYSVGTPTATWSPR